MVRWVINLIKVVLYGWPTTTHEEIVREAIGKCIWLCLTSIFIAYTYIPVYYCLLRLLIRDVARVCAAKNIRYFVSDLRPKFIN
jgi:hypothetical protein